MNENFLLVLNNSRFFEEGAEEHAVS